MKIAHLIPGTGHWHCGSCLRDAALVRALRARGHDAWAVPLYLPAFPEDRELLTAPRVHLGGVNLYLQQKLPLLRRLPRWIQDRLDSPRLLRSLARLSGMTDARLLGAMSVAMLEGERGPFRDELEKLAAALESGERPELLCLSNALLLGLARPLGERLGIPVVCCLQGEEPFVDALPGPYRERVWDLLRKRARDAAACAAVSRWYGERMRLRLGLAPERLRVVRNGIDPAPLAPEGESAPVPPTVGFLARMCRDKGLETLVAAFVSLKARAEFEDLRLRVAGAQLREDRPLVRALQRRLRAAGFVRDVEFSPNLAEADKGAFLRSLSVLSVPATYGESFGLYVLEAWAAGVPVVQPRHGAFPELLEIGGGGLLCAPDDSEALAAGLARLLGDEELRHGLGRRGRAALTREFGAEHMAQAFEGLCLDVLDRREAMR